MKYRVKERWNIYKGKVWEVQTKTFGFLWTSEFDNWFTDESKAKEVARRLNNHEPLGDIIDEEIKKK